MRARPAIRRLPYGEPVNRPALLALLLTATCALRDARVTQPVCNRDSQCGGGNLCNDEGKCYQTCSADGDCPRHAVDATYGCAGAAPRRFCDVLGTSDGGATD